MFNMWNKIGFSKFYLSAIFLSQVKFSTLTNSTGNSTVEILNVTSSAGEDDSKFILGPPLNDSQLNTNLPPPDPMDAKLDAVKLIQKNGYPFEAHEYTTEDGYILTLHRIPRPGATAVLAMHGILCSSRDWLMQRGNNSLAYMLYNAGYDVWLANMRGNPYSQGHVQYHSKDPRYWDFNVDSISYFDIPSTIDHVLATTNKAQLIYLGYSLGTTTLFSQLIVNQEYQDKVKCFAGLAPVAYKGNCKSPVIRALANLALPEQPLKLALDIPGKGRFLPRLLTAASNMFLPLICSHHVDRPDICGNSFGLVGGLNPTQHDNQMEPIILGEFPSPISTQTFIQQLQHVVIGAGKFRNYFYQNISKNVEKYSSLFPPELDLTQFRVESYLFAGENDFLAPPEDVLLMVEKLPNVRLYHNITDPTWNHLDFLYGKQARELVYELVIEKLVGCLPP